MIAAQEPRAGEVLKPCPFCGDEMASVVCGEIYHKNGDRDCPIIGRDAYIPAEKVAAWNTRPSESSASVGGEGHEGLIADLEALLAAEPVFVVGHPISRAIAALRTQAPAREGEVEGREAARLLDECIWYNPDTANYEVNHDGSVEKARIDAALSRQHQEGEGR